MITISHWFIIVFFKFRYFILNVFIFWNFFILSNTISFPSLKRFLMHSNAVSFPSLKSLFIPLIMPFSALFFWHHYTYEKIFFLNIRPLLALYYTKFNNIFIDKYGLKIYIIYWLLIRWLLLRWVLLTCNLNKTPLWETGYLGNPYFLHLVA